MRPLPLTADRARRALRSLAAAHHDHAKVDSKGKAESVVDEEELQLF